MEFTSPYGLTADLRKEWYQNGELRLVGARVWLSYKGKRTSSAVMELAPNEIPKITKQLSKLSRAKTIFDVERVLEDLELSFYHSAVPRDIGLPEFDQRVLSGRFNEWLRDLLLLEAKRQGLDTAFEDVFINDRPYTAFSFVGKGAGTMGFQRGSKTVVEVDSPSSAKSVKRQLQRAVDMLIKLTA